MSRGKECIFFWLTSCLKLLSSSFTSFARESQKEVSSILISTWKALMSSCIAAILADRLSAVASVSAIPSVVFSVFSGFDSSLILDFFCFVPLQLSLLPSGRRLRSIRSRTSRLRVSFFPQAIRLMNSQK